MKAPLKNILKSIPAVLGAGALSGCATMFSGTSQEVEISSFPNGASLYSNGEYVGKTPLTVEMDRDSHPLIVLKKDGYADTRIQIEREWNGMTMLNLLFLPGFCYGFPITGWIIDARSGATSEYTEDDIVVPVLTKDALRATYYKGNVTLTNLNTTDEMKSSEKEIREALEREIQSYIEPIFGWIRDTQTHTSRRYRATGTAWVRAEIADDGTIASFKVEKHQGHAKVKDGAKTVFSRLQRTFSVPEELQSILPLSILVPVEYTK